MTDLEKQLLADLTCKGKDCNDCFREFNATECPASNRVQLNDEKLNKDSILYKYAKIIDDCLDVNYVCRECKVGERVDECPRQKYRKLARAEYEQSGFDTLYINLNINLINDKDLCDILGE